jgi:hypothetical protein
MRLSAMRTTEEKEDNVEFKEFEKIARLNREVVVTEKIDGTSTPAKEKACLSG